MVTDKKLCITIITFVLFIHMTNVNSIIQPTNKDFLKFHYLNCTNQIHKNTKTASLFHGVNLYKHTPFDYIILQPNLCRGTVDVLFYVQTSLNHFSKRKLIRQTFGSLKWINGKRTVLLFVIGDRPKDKQSQRELKVESSVYQDIVQANFYDSYRNLTRKHLVMLDWVSNFCSHAKFISKSDDDIFINPFALLATLYSEKFNHTELFILGEINYNLYPLSIGSKWDVTEEEYPRHLGGYPPFMKGFAYIISQAAIKPLWFCSYFRPYLFIDDLFITGLVVKSMQSQVKQYHINRTLFKVACAMSKATVTHLVYDYIYFMDTTEEAPIWKLAWQNSLRSSINYDEWF